MKMLRRDVLLYYRDGIETLLKCLHGQVTADVLNHSMLCYLPVPVMDVTPITRLLEDYAFQRRNDCEGLMELVETLHNHPFKLESISAWKYGQHFINAEHYCAKLQRTYTICYGELLRNVLLLMIFK